VPDTRQIVSEKSGWHNTSGGLSETVEFWVCAQIQNVDSCVYSRFVIRDFHLIG